MSGPRQHLGFPFRIAPDGRTATPATVEEHVEQELIQLLLTDLGERLFRPELGTNLRRMVFQPIDGAAMAVPKAAVSQAVGRWLGGRITVEELEIGADDSTVEVGLRYRIGAGPSRALRLRSTRP